MRMEEAEQSHYVTQLKAEFDSCDTTSTGFLDREELTVLCQKLQLDAHLPLLLDSLLGQNHYARVNFEEFKEGFVSVLSRSLDFSTSEDDSSYLEPVVPNEVKPKFVRGAKRYGRRSRPDRKSEAALTCDSEDLPSSRAEGAESSPTSVRRAKLRRSTSLESVESLKSDEEAGSQRVLQADAHSDAPQQEEQGIVGGGEGDQLGLNSEEVESLLRKLDADFDGRLSLRDFQNVLCGSAPLSCSTPLRPVDLQRTPHGRASPPPEHSVRSTTPSLLTATVGQRVLSRLDDGSGCTSPERVVALWTKEGIRHSRDILQTLDFPLEERLSLVDLTLALDNELLLSGNGIHQVALISYKNEIQQLQLVAEQACSERDKVRADLDLADHRNLKLIREVDERHASMETLNQSRIRDLEQDFRDRLAALRSQSEQESEALLQQAEQELRLLQEELQLLRAQEAELQEELCSATQENGRLEEELSEERRSLKEAQSCVRKLQTDLNQLLHDKFGSLDPSGAGLSPEERFCDLVKELELQCRELRDRNDELSSELELLKSQRSDRKWRRSAGDAAPSWTQGTESDSDDLEMKRHPSPLVKKILQPVDKTGLSSLDSVSGPGVSIQTELALEQLKQKHNQELQQLHIQLDTQVNFYERSLELMRQSMEVERKDISQAFKLEISELEEHKAQAEQQVHQLQSQLQGGARSSEQERRVQWEQAELEQNFAREIGNLVQRLSAEKDQLEAELKLKMDQELMVVREESERQHAEAQRRLQEQRGLWEKLTVQSEQQQEEERARICSRFSSEKKMLEEQHQEVVSGLQRRISQSEAGLQESRRCCAQLEDHVCSSRARCVELEVRLEEACAQLEDSIHFLESHEVLSKRLEEEKSSLEAELQLVKTREEELLVQVTQLKEELEILQAASRGLLLEQAQLREQGAELENLQEVTRSKTAELDSLKTDRARLIQDLKEQAMARDTLQLQLDTVREELNRRRSTGEQLHEALQQEQNRTSQLCSGLEEEKEEVCRLSQENGSYARLADQLSTQIVEMEEEISSLRHHLRDLSSQLNGTADLVLDLRRQLNSRTSQLERLRSEEAHSAELLRHARSNSEGLQQELKEAEERRRRSEEAFEEEKKKMRQQLMDLEMLVLALEDLNDPESPHRTQLEEVRSEKGALQERVNVLQRDVQNLEDDVHQKRRKLEEVEKDHERSREEEERLHKENSRFREEVLDLSGRNLQLSNDNAELSAHRRGDQESVRMLRERLATVSKEQEEERATVQEAARQQEREKTTWTQEKRLLEAELGVHRDKMGRLSEQEAELSAVTQRLRRLEEEKLNLQREADAHNNKVETLQQSVLRLESEAERLRSQLHAVTGEKLGHAQEVTHLQEKLEDARVEGAELESSLRMLREQEEQGETHRLRVQNQELQHQLTELQVKGQEVQELTQEQQNLRTRVKELEEQVARAEAALSAVQAQRVRQLHELRERVGGGHRDRAELLEARLVEEQRRNQQLEETLRLQAHQSSSQISLKQDQYEKATSSLQQRTEELETKMRGVRAVLQEKVQQLKEQLVKNAKSSALLKDLYVENSQLMKALQVTEQRQKNAEKKNFLLDEKVAALNGLLRRIVPASLAT